ncbi:MAG: MBL fold metallo-hydrolase, partial [Chloroflexi bacterium]|nr:MBL fold metallo-hydrolase [Chloroflexota bacterium]
MEKQIPIDPGAVNENQHGSTHEVTSDIIYQRLAIVNVLYYGLPDAGDRQWVLIDAGLFGATTLIVDAAEHRFGKAARPAAIVLTHGHFDHVGALKNLAERWDAPIYAHELELPYLDGRSAYPPPDPTVGGGLMSTLSRFYPRGPIDVSHWLHPLPANGDVPEMPGWQWIHTPGHAPGHVSLWRAADRTLIAGDAFITTKQESAFAVAMQRPEIHGPPMYYTPDWQQAHQSVLRLAALEPELVVTGHGPAMQGSEMRSALHTLARDFEQIAVPDQGRYVNAPAQADASGVTYVP